MIDNYEEIITNFTSPTCIIAGSASAETYLLADTVTRLLKNGVNKNT